MALKIEELEKRHNRSKFDCDEPALNDFLKNVARQKHEKLVVRTYVLVEDEDAPTEILGFYSLVPSSIEFPEQHKLTKRLGPCPPVIRLARLAVSKQEHGQGLGTYLVIEALRRVVDSSLSVGGIGCVVDAKTEKVKRFYEKLGFAPIDSTNTDGLALWLPMAECVKAVNLADQAGARMGALDEATS